MPPRGIQKGTKRARQYEHIKEGQRERGTSERRAEEIAARTVNKERAPVGRVAQPLAHLDRGHLVLAPRRSALGHGPGEGPHPRSAVQRGA
jgi:hypothetical protein